MIYFLAPVKTAENPVSYAINTYITPLLLTMFSVLWYICSSVIYFNQERPLRSQCMKAQFNKTDIKIVSPH